jgi:hypothetical protein
VKPAATNEALLHTSLHLIGAELPGMVELLSLTQPDVLTHYAWAKSGSIFRLFSNHVTEVL